MRYAIFKEDIGYDNCPIYIFNKDTNMYEINGSSTISFSLEDVVFTDDFFLFGENFSIEKQQVNMYGKLANYKN